MSVLDIRCTTCGYTRQVPADKVPAGTVRVTCPQCKQTFPYTKPAAPAASGAVPPRPQASQPPPAQPDKGATPPRPAARPATPPPPTQPKPPTNPPARKEMLEIGALFSASWQLFQRRFGTLIGLYLVTVVAFIAPLAMAAGLAIYAGATSSVTTAVIAGCAGVLGSLYLGFRCFGGFLHAVVDERLGFKDALDEGAGSAIALLWIGCLTGFVIGGGFMLLVIPGIIFTVWFFFAQFALVQDGSHGMDALLASREYVRGQWFNVALRLMLVWVLSILLGIVPVAGPLLTIASIPFVMIFHYLVYRDLHEMKGALPIPGGAMDRLCWPAVALAGHIIVPVIVIAVAGPAIKAKLSMVPMLRAQASSSSITVTQPATMPTGTGDASGYRVITFPAPSAAGSEASGGTSPSGFQASAATAPASAADEQPEGVYVFIYSVNYGGSVSANGTVIKELEGKPDVQYNYNMGGTGLRYGQNQIEVQFSELPEHHQSFLSFHLRISRNSKERGQEQLGNWEFSDKGSGSKSFTVDIAR